MKISIIRLLTSSLLIMVISQAQAIVFKNKPIVLTLKDAVLLSLRNNPSVQQEEIQRVADKFALVLAKNQFQPQYAFTASNSFSHAVSSGAPSSSTTWAANPSVTLENNYGTALDLTSTNTLTNGTYNPEMELQVTQPLIRGFGKPVVDAALNNAKDTEIINRLTFKSTAISTVSTVINDYLSLVQSYQTYAVDKDSLNNYEQTVTNDRAMIAAGSMAKSDIVQAEAQVESQKATLQTDLTNIETSKNQLLNALGLPPRTPITVPKHFNFVKVEKEIEGEGGLPDLTLSSNAAVANNIAYQQSLITIRTLRRNLLVDQDNQRWQLNLTASETLGGGSGGGQNAGLKSLTNGSNHNETAGLSLTVPIDDVSAQNATIDQQVSLEQALIGLQESKRSLLETVQTDYNTVVNNKKGLKISLDALKLQKQTVYISEQKQLAGRVSTFEVITNQKNLSTQLETVVDNEISYLQSLVALEQEAGVVLEPWYVKLRY